MIDWKRKLTSRKMWAAICNLVGMVILACGGKQEVAVQVTEIIAAAAGVVAYIISEGLVDAANVGMIDYEIVEDEDEANG